MNDHSRRLRQLTQQLRRFERAQRPAGHSADPISTGIAELDLLLPDQGVRRGMLLEWLAAERAGGTGTLAFKVAAALQRRDAGCVVIDRRRSLYPPVLRCLGVDLARVLVVHPPGERDVLWAWEQALRCPGVAVVVGGMEQVRPQDFRRLQLAAERGGAVGMLLRCARWRPQASWADVRLLVEPSGSRCGTAVGARRGFFPPAAAGISQSAPPDVNPAARSDVTLAAHSNDRERVRRLRVELLHCRGRLSGGSVMLEIDDATGDVRLASRLAAAKSRRHAAGA